MGVIYFLPLILPFRQAIMAHSAVQGLDENVKCDRRRGIDKSSAGICTPTAQVEEVGGSEWLVTAGWVTAFSSRNGTMQYGGVKRHSIGMSYLRFAIPRLSVMGKTAVLAVRKNAHGRKREE